MENDCYYISSRGLLKSCDIYSLTPVSSINKLINYNFPNLDTESKCPQIIYICNSAIPDFIENYFNKINFNFILVSGDCDETCPDDIFKNNEDFLNFINSDKLIHWYSQNCINDHSKLTRLPIGLDYHTLSENDHQWGSKQIPIEQEKSIIKLLESSKPFWERNVKCYSNFHFSMHDFYKFRYDRLDAIEKIPNNLIYYEEVLLPRMKTHEKQLEHAFIISPHGNGLDCHRTWEALILGCIPIVKTSKLDSLFDELPVLIVNDWSDITLELLNETIIKFKEINFNYHKLTLEYWINKIVFHK
jgi:hypothetical protein